MNFSAIDLFSGGGGLTVGLKRAGFIVVGAVENEEHAYTTYKANHPEIRALKQNVTSISGKCLLEIGQGKIDLLAGCPPCQGFTSLTRKYRRNDDRNKLIFQMSRLADEVRPRAIMMENVPGLTREGRSAYQQLTHRLRKLGYRLMEDVLEVANFGVPQFRRRLVLVGGLGFDIDLPEPTHSRDGRAGLSSWRTVKDAIGHMQEPVVLEEARKRGDVRQSDWHVVRKLSPKNVKRIQAAKSGKTWPSIPEELRPRCHQGDYRGFTNVYGRMEWDLPSPTITGGCTTFSKGRFGHPVRDRTISVREAALLQTFPKDYKFDTPYMEYVCSIIGNALPCDFAQAVSRKCRTALAKNNQ